MSDKRAKSEEPLPSAEQVASYLRKHPAFFAEFDELLPELIIPHERGHSISLVERQVKLLRERNIEMRNRLNQLMDVARDNDRLFEKSRRLILDLLEADSQEQIIAQVEDSLRNDFQVPYASLILFSETERFSNARCVTHQVAREAIGHLLDSGKTLSGILRPDELTFLFGDSGKDVASCALSPIQHQGLHGVLALGSRDAGHYKQASGTLFLGFIADTLGRLLLHPPQMRDEAPANDA